MSTPRPRPDDRLAAVCGIAGAALSVASLWPGAGFPAWPAASSGALAVLLALRPGNPLLRGAAATLGLLALVVGAVQIAGLWAMGSALN